MADEQKPEGGAAEPVKPPAEAPKAAAPKPAAPAHAGGHAPPKQLKENFGDQITECATYLGQNFVVAKPDAVMPVLEFLKLEANFDYLVDITAVDYPNRAERFDLLYILYSFDRNERVRVKTMIADGTQPPTAVNIHAGANWLEREVFDMFGIQFAGHPDMRRILLPEEWEGFPLRKEMSIVQQDDRWVKENLGIESGQ